MNKIQRIKMVMDKLGFSIREAKDYVDADKDIGNPLLDSMPDLPGRGRNLKIVDSVGPDFYPTLADLLHRAAAAVQRLVDSHEEAILSGAKDLEAIWDEGVTAVLGPDPSEEFFSADALDDDSDLPAEDSVEEQLYHEQIRLLGRAWGELFILARRLDQLDENQAFGVSSPETVAAIALTWGSEELDRQESIFGPPEERPVTAAMGDTFRFLYWPVSNWIFNVQGGITSIGPEWPDEEGVG